MYLQNGNVYLTDHDKLLVMRFRNHEAFHLLAALFLHEDERVFAVSADGLHRKKLMHHQPGGEPWTLDEYRRALALLLEVGWLVVEHDGDPETGKGRLVSIRNEPVELGSKADYTQYCKPRTKTRWTQGTYTPTTDAPWVGERALLRWRAGLTEAAPAKPPRY